MSTETKVRFNRKMGWFYAMTILVLCFACVSARWQYHRTPRMNEEIKYAHEDIDGECIRTRIRKVTTSKSIGFPRVETTIKVDTNILVGRDSHWFRRLAGLLEYKD